MRDPDSLAVLRELRRRRGGPPELLAYRAGRRWRGVHSDDINAYLKAHAGEAFSAEDFRTWNATVLAAAALAARTDPARTAADRKRVINAAVKEVAGVLGNTPAVARRSYIDPRVFDRYQSGWTIAPAMTEAQIRLDETSDRRRRRLELAVLDLLEERVASRAIEVAEAV